MRSRSSTLFALFVCASLQLFGGGFRQDFESPTLFTSLSPSGYTTAPVGDTGRWGVLNHPEAVSITTEQAASGTHSAKVTRCEKSQYPLAVTFGKEPVPMPFVASIRFRRGNASAFGLSLDSTRDDGKRVAAFQMSCNTGGVVSVYDRAAKRNSPTAGRASGDEWQQLRFYAVGETVRLELVSSGKVQDLGAFPANELKESGLAVFTLVASVSEPGMSTYFDDFLLEQGEKFPEEAVAAAVAETRAPKAANQPSGDGFRQDFESPTLFTSLSSSGYTTAPIGKTGRWGVLNHPEAVSITTEQAASGTHSAKVTRCEREKNQPLTVNFGKDPIPMPFVASIRFRRENGSAFTLDMNSTGPDGKSAHALQLACNRFGVVSVFDRVGNRYFPTMGRDNGGEWQQLRLYAAGEGVRIELVSGGKAQDLGSFPANELTQGGLTAFTLVASVSDLGLSTYFDDFLLEPGEEFPAEAAAGSGAANAPVTYGRAYIEYDDGTKVDAPQLVDGKLGNNDGVSLETMPATMYIELAPPTDVSVVKIHTGSTLWVGCPSGDTSIKDYTVEILSNGSWLQVASATGQPDFVNSNAKGVENFYSKNVFPITRAEMIRIRVTDSNDTGNRQSGFKKWVTDKRSCHVRGVEVLPSESAGLNVRDIKNMLEGDFEWAVYRYQEEAVAKLRLCDDVKPFPVRWLLRPELGDQPIRTGELAAREDSDYSITLPLKEIPDGRYVLEVRPQADDSNHTGMLHRMLRVDRGFPVPHAVEPIDMAGNKLFPVDEYHLARREGVVNESAHLKIYQATEQRDPMRNHESRGANALNIYDDGTFVMQFVDATRGGNDRKTRFASSKNLVDWEITDTRPPENGKVEKVNRNNPSVYQRLPAAAVPRWQIKTPRKDAVMRFYDAERDGVPPLNEVRLAYFPTRDGDVTQFGLKQFGYYPVWEKRPGEWLVLIQEPLQIDRFTYPGDELESVIDGNDNFGTQFLTDDGKTLIVSKAAKMRRFTPYTIEHDNLPFGCRIMRIFWTHDGIHWERKVLTAPSDNDHWSFQHYGFLLARVNKDFYLAYMHAYHCLNEQIYPELVYSRDGLRWDRLPGHPPFIAPTAPGTWLFGMNFMEHNTLAYKDKYYLPIGRATRRPHFYNTYHDDLSHITPYYLERSYAGRKLEEWPYFKPLGGWEGLAKEMHAAQGSVGFAEMRKDGWIVVHAGDKGGLLESRVLVAKGCRLFLNGKGGFRLTLQDEKGNPLTTYGAATCNGDNVAFPVQWENGDKLPDQPFRVKIEMEPQSEIYTLSFE